MSKVYLIQDDIGHHEDNRTSIIKAFSSRDQAEAYRGKYNNLLDMLCDHVDKMHKRNPNGDYFESVFNDVVYDYISCKLIEIELL